jgi:hypothetical protein
MHTCNSTKPRRPTFAELARLEPALNDLLAEAKAHRRKAGRHFCANDVWYGYDDPDLGLKRQLSALVGWHADPGADPRLRTCAAYDVAYQAIYAGLPDCRDCGCLRLEDLLG